MRVVWTIPANRNREAIISFIEQDNPLAAIEMDVLFTKAADSLSTLPLQGRKGRVAGTRELIVHRNYILVYSYDIKTEKIYITTVLHALRQYPPII